MSSFKRYVCQNKTLYATWAEDDRVYFSESQDNGKHWSNALQVAHLIHITDIDFNVDELGSVYLLAEDLEQTHLFIKKHYQADFTQAFLERKLSA